MMIWFVNNLLVDINECESNPCENDGTCTDREDGYTCACASGFTGTECQTGRLIFSLSSEIFHLLWAFRCTLFNVFCML